MADLFIALQQFVFKGSFNADRLQLAPRRIFYNSVVFHYYMQDNIVVRFIRIMLMPVPVRGQYMYLNISCPEGISDPDPCILEVRAWVLVVNAGVDNAQLLTIDCL